MKRSDARSGVILVTVLWSIALLSALAMAASVTGVVSVGTECEMRLGDIVHGTGLGPRLSEDAALDSRSPSLLNRQRDRSAAGRFATRAARAFERSTP